MQIDHIVVAAADLETAKLEFFDMTGVMPVDGGPHPGGGTRNALVAFSSDCYLEIIAPDPQQDLKGTNGERFAALAKTELLHWAVRSSDLEALSNQIATALEQAHSQPSGDSPNRPPIRPGPIYNMARDTPTGERLAWRLMGVQKHNLGGLIPFFIDWQDTPHPTQAAPVVGALHSLQLSLPSSGPQDDVLVRVLGTLDDPCFSLVTANSTANSTAHSTTKSDEKTDAGGLKVQFESAKGRHSYGAQTPAGFAF